MAIHLPIWVFKNLLWVGVGTQMRNPVPPNPLADDITTAPSGPVAYTVIVRAMSGQVRVFSVHIQKQAVVARPIAMSAVVLEVIWNVIKLHSDLIKRVKSSCHNSLFKEALLQKPD